MRRGRRCGCIDAPWTWRDYGPPSTICDRNPSASQNQRREPCAEAVAGIDAPRSGADAGHVPECDMPNNVEELLEKSASTDIQVLLTAKENAKRAALDDPSQANLAALERASKMLESAMTASKNLKNWREVLAHVSDNGRKLGKTKLFTDIGAGRLRKQPDGSFRLRDVERYMASLPMAGTPDSVAVKAAERQRRKEEADIRRAEVDAEARAFDLEVKKGKYVLKDQVHLELAARAVTLASGLKTAFEAQGLDLVATAGGDAKKTPALVERLESILDEALNEYSREVEFEVTFEPAREVRPEGDMPEPQDE